MLYLTYLDFIVITGITVYFTVKIYRNFFDKNVNKENKSKNKEFKFIDADKEFKFINAD